MRIPDSHVQVMIIGAGPSGLMMAAQLLRYGVQPVIIDSKQGPTSHSKALAVQARSMEIYRQMGLADRVLQGSTYAQGMHLYQEGKEIAQLELEGLGTQQTPFPHIYLYEQYKTERLLLDELTQHCCPVYWNTTLTAFQENAVSLQLQLATDGDAYEVSCNWLVGADGAHSIVRKLLQIPFTGDTYAHQFFLADVKLSNKKLNHRYLHLYLSSKGFAAFFLMPEEGAYRIVGSIPPSVKTENLQFNDIIAPLNKIVDLKVEVAECRWFTTYKLHHRMADKFSMDKCFLIGDAAHIHSPVGGQGMNTGLQDAYNLAWKLAGVVNQQFKTIITDSYAIERMPVATELIKTTDRMFSLITSQKLTARLLKQWILPYMLKWGWKKENIKKEFFNRISQINIAYRSSPLSLHLSQSDKVKAGDRLPYLKIYDEKKKQETDLHAWCRKPGFTLITLGPLDEQEIFSLAKWITQTYNNRLNFFHLPPSARNQLVFDHFEVKLKHLKSLIVRPDMHLGLVADSTDKEILGNYLNNVVGFAL